MLYKLNTKLNDLWARGKRYANSTTYMGTRVAVIGL